MYYNDPIKCTYMTGPRSNCGQDTYHFLSDSVFKMENRYSQHSMCSTHGRLIAGIQDYETGVVPSVLPLTVTTGFLLKTRGLPVRQGQSDSKAANRKR
jgi:hypothetical protein